MCVADIDCFGCWKGKQLVCKGTEEHYSHILGSLSCKRPNIGRPSITLSNYYNCWFVYSRLNSSWPSKNYNRLHKSSPIMVLEVSGLNSPVGAQQLWFQPYEIIIFMRKCTLPLSPQPYLVPVQSVRVFTLLGTLQNIAFLESQFCNTSTYV